MEASKKQLMRDAFNSGRYSRALRIANKYLRTNPGDWDALYMKASIYSAPLPKYCDYYSAIGIILFALDADRDDVKRWHAAADVFEMAGLYAEAERCYRKVLEMDPTNYQAIIALTVHRRAHGTQVTAEEARTLLETAISSKPDEWNAYHHLAVLLRELGDKKKAMEMYESALARLPETDEYGMRPGLEKQIKILKEELTEVN